MFILMLVSAVLGFATPWLMFGPVLEEPNYAQRYFVVTLGYAYLIIRKVGRPRPRLWKWITISPIGCIATAMLGGVMTSGLALAFGAIPAPSFAHWMIAGLLCVFALLSLVRDEKKTSF